ncbi:hypothetical protein K505DRAFT_300904 [Melanomma pulvis-pyrius CBS 109.77]|uniref:Uncharacterized protein n=1 Tax=Melanomma pulvis-pyrius CBS 109.77 TaxID=1314802 RepID=A0A6A6XIV5_9PLEO|nr:hypothetical protein K505DRAFT_300904 [Melanomma pulvis-pyrius CBS 109.77]
MVAIPNGAEARESGHISWNSAEGSTTLNSDSLSVVRQRNSPRTYSLKALPKPRVEVLAIIDHEETVDSKSLLDPDRVREGSTSGWLTTLAIMSGMEDARYVLPELQCIKIHEVRDLKKWLVEHGYLHRSGAISRIERVLHFLFTVQMGCRLETIATLFSRSPRQVESSCKDVLEGILQMHSETELPRSGGWPIYPHLWHTSKKYEVSHEWAKMHYPWSVDDFQMVLVTINLFIGRYRKQGQVALGGPFLDWGKYVQPERTAEEE